jgi:hypothetical protein
MKPFKIAPSIGTQARPAAGSTVQRVALLARIFWAFVALCALGSITFAQTCPIVDQRIESAKSHKLFLYFPTMADPTFPPFPSYPDVPNVTPAQPFDAADLSNNVGTTGQLINEIRKVVADDYCEFDVQVLTTRVNPGTFMNPPPRRATVAIGSDVNKYIKPQGVENLWGQAQENDIDDKIAIDFARVWAGTFTVCEGGLGPNAVPGGCSATGSLTGNNDTRERWAEVIGGTAAHEAAHTYGLTHADDDPQIDPCKPLQAGPPPTSGEDAFYRHLMPTGCNLTGPERADYRRHFSYRDYGFLATNVGLSIETMHNWELVNPNAEQASALVIDFLSPLPSISISWNYHGSMSPWLNPMVNGALGTAVFNGKTYNKFQLIWSNGNPAWRYPSPGVVAGGAVFNVGTTFTGVDFNRPEPIIIQNVTLLDASYHSLTLHPQLPSYDTGAALKNEFAVNFFAPANAPALQVAELSILQLPQLASIESLVSKENVVTRDGRIITPWASTKCAAGLLQDTISCAFASLDQKPWEEATYEQGQPGVFDCINGVPVKLSPGTPDGNSDSSLKPRSKNAFIPPRFNGIAPPGVSDSALADERFDDKGPVCAGSQRDPFPSAVVYVYATFVDENARHFDPKTKEYAVGPVRSRLFYQFAGIRHLAERASLPASIESRIIQLRM